MITNCEKFLGPDRQPIKDIYYYVVHNDIKQVECILKECPSDSNKLHEILGTPLIYCSINNRIDCTNLLLKYGANPNYITDDGYSPLVMAIASGHKEVVKILCKHNAHVGNEHIFLTTDPKLLATENGKEIFKILQKEFFRRMDFTALPIDVKSLFLLK